MQLGHCLVSGDALLIIADHMLPIIPTSDRVLYEKGLCQPAVDRVQNGLEAAGEVELPEDAFQMVLGC